jgi:hypothetical protein
VCPQVGKAAKLFVFTLPTLSRQRAGVMTGLTSFVSLRDHDTVLPNAQHLKAGVSHIFSFVFYLVMAVYKIYSLLLSYGYKWKFSSISFDKTYLNLCKSLSGVVGFVVLMLMPK